MSIGLGIDYLLGGAELDRPDGASARLRLASGLTLEPTVRLATHGQSTDSAAGETDDAQNEFVLGSNVRYALKSRGKVDLIAQVGGGLAFLSNDPEGDDNNTNNLNFAIDYGLGVEYWVSSNWCLSFTATNPFLIFDDTTTEVANIDDTSQTNIDIGVIWDPVTRLSVHLFY